MKVVPSTGSTNCVRLVWTMIMDQNILDNVNRGNDDSLTTEAMLENVRETHKMRQNVI